MPEEATVLNTEAAVHAVQRPDACSWRDQLWVRPGKHLLLTSSNLELDTRLMGMYFWLVPCCSSSQVLVSLPLSSLYGLLKL
jgi:hypothetical protein